jgi:hypothetical protein
MPTRAAQQLLGNCLPGDSGVRLRNGMPAPRGIGFALDDRMDARSVRGQQDGEAASETKESPSFTIDDRLAGVRPPVQSLPRLRTPVPIRRARGPFAYFTRTERAPSTLPDAFYVCVGFPLTRVPSHKILLSFGPDPAPSDVR